MQIQSEPAQPKPTVQVRVSHILRKHAGSRRPASWRCAHITQSKEESIQQIQEIKRRLERTLEENGFDAMCQLFSQIAQTDSDCSSAQKGGERQSVFFHSATQNCKI